MKTITTLFTGLALLASATVMAEPYPVMQASPGATTYDFFLIKEKKLRDKMTVAQATEVLAQALAPYGVTPCIVASDSNGSIACGKPSEVGFMMPLANEFFTYDMTTNFQDLPPIRDKKRFNKDGQYDQVYAVNFRQPTGDSPGDSRGRAPVHVQFADPVTEFSMRVDGGQATSPASTAIQFVVNGVALPPQPLTPGTPVVVGVADPAGFTEVGIVALGGGTQAFVASDFAFVSMP